MSRLRKFKTNRKLKVIINIVAVCYLSFFILSYLASGTGAYFLDSNQSNVTLQAGTWWDGSNLEITSEQNQNIEACSEIVITTELKNTGNSMMTSTEYEVFLNNEKIFDEGLIDSLATGETENLEYTATEEGLYHFKVYQSPGYNDNYETISEVWSEEIKVNCIEDNDKADNQEEQEIEEKTGETNVIDENAQEASEQEDTVSEQDEEKEENVQQEETPTKEIKQEDTINGGTADTGEEQENNQTNEESEAIEKETQELGTEQEQKTEPNVTVQETETNVTDQETQNEEVEENESEEN